MEKHLVFPPNSAHGIYTDLIEIEVRSYRKMDTIICLLYLAFWILVIYFVGD